MLSSSDVLVGRGGAGAGAADADAADDEWARASTAPPAAAAAWPGSSLRAVVIF